MSDQSSVEWRPVVGYEGIYEVSSTGIVRRIVGGRGGVPQRIMSIGKGRSGYPSVTLTKFNQTKAHFLHRLVAASFLGPCPDGMEVNHKDRNRANPCLSNLEYVTRSGNMKHAFENGVVPKRGEERPNAKLTEDDVRLIRSSKEKARVVAARYGINLGTVYDIRLRRTWRHVA